MGYTETEKPGKFWDTLVLFTVGKGTLKGPSGYLYTTCAHHAEQVPVEEGKRFKKDEIGVRAWLHFPTAQGGKTCDVCYQLERGGDPNEIRPISRVNTHRRNLR